ncbi:hypothetical protein HYT33_03480 [Candidatus Roizmanbacteria bacterium]|nr:hypothetical protein [Candidatus Roizmanbacteria bacterium]
MVYAVNLKDPSVNPLSKFGELASIVNLVVPVLTIGGALLFLAMLFYGGFTVITAGGDAKKVERAQQIIKYSFVGLIIIISSFLIVKVLGVIIPGLGETLPL